MRGLHISLGAARRRHPALAQRSYRWYFCGQLGSLIGTGLQTSILTYWVLSLTGSTRSAGLVVFYQLAPAVVCGPYAGAFIDRIHSKRNVMIVLQLLMAAQAAGLGLIAQCGHGHAWVLWAIDPTAGVLGVLTALEMPARAVLIEEMVGSDRVSSAWASYSMAVNLGGAIGGLLGGLLISYVGVAACFYANGASFALVVASLLFLDDGALQRAPVTARERGQVRAGLRFTLETPRVWGALSAIVLGAFVMQYPVLVPALTRAQHGGAVTDGVLYGVVMAGALVAGAAGDRDGGERGLRELRIAGLGGVGATLLVALAARGGGHGLHGLVLRAVELLALAALGWAGGRS